MSEISQGVCVKPPFHFLFRSLQTWQLRTWVVAGAVDLLCHGAGPSR